MSKEDWAWNQVRAKPCTRCNGKVFDHYMAHVQVAHKGAWEQYIASRTNSTDVQISKMPKRIKRLFGYTYD